jgi:hypothetical protein
MSGVSLKAGSGPYGLSLMKFTLTYDGELRSNDRPRAKWEIRKHFHPQLKTLWTINPVLIAVERNRLIPTSESVMTQSGAGGDIKMTRHHRMTGAFTNIDVCAPLKRGNYEFIPLVRESLALKCGLKIIFLGKEEPGRLYQGGDLDNRIKTLFDALSVPNSDQLIGDHDTGPTYCLLEDDSLISRIEVDTQQLLRGENGSKHEVQLIIEVDVRITKFHAYNSPFLGE